MKEELRQSMPQEEKAVREFFPIGKEEVRAAAKLLQKYKQGKRQLENRIVQDEQWWKLRHWDFIRNGDRPGPEPASGWLFNAILNKHADAMDSFPEPLVLPREPGDAEGAKVLSACLPTVLEYNDFESVYSQNWWEKLKHGTAAYGVFWDNLAGGGKGDISIRTVNLLKLFWEPGVTDLQESPNLFLVEQCERKSLLSRWPELHDKPLDLALDVKKYPHEDEPPEDDKVLVVDWYYKLRDGKRTVLHYCKFVGETVLYASENDPILRERGWYDHGKYPIVLDRLFPEKDMPVGFGYVSVCKDPQMYIDKLFGNLLEYSMKASKPRAWVSSSANINEEEYLDWSKPLVHVEGEIDERRVRDMHMPPLSSVYVEIAKLKIEEMRETAANREVNAGSTPNGVTAASAIAALQESGSKTSRDMIAASYRAYGKICALCIELMRQFYDEARTFRITGADGSISFGNFSADDLRGRELLLPTGETVLSEPIFDVKLSAQKKNPFSRMEQNQRAMELFAAGFFDAPKAQAALAALEMMNFEGIEQVRNKVRENLTAAQESAKSDVSPSVGSQGYVQRLAKRTEVRV